MEIAKQINAVILIITTGNIAFSIGDPRNAFFIS